MVEAQEMFKISNKPEKALILGFMAGSRGKYEIVELSEISFILSPAVEKQ